MNRLNDLVRRVQVRLGRDVGRLYDAVRYILWPSHPDYGQRVGSSMSPRFDWLKAPVWADLFVGKAQGLEQLRRHCTDLMLHRFDLLGSGPTVVRHGMAIAGLDGHRYDMRLAVAIDSDGRWLASAINRTNRARSQRVWALIDPDYQLIDWQIDFKSGYRWSERQRSTELRMGHLPGVDVKVPWELARFQHLPLLALACHAAGYGEAGFLPAATYAREVRNQILDFIAANPPGFGVNWMCCMDVGIRVANILLAWDILRAAPIEPDPDFEAILLDSIQAHGNFVATHLEWHSVFRGNHYLADIVGLLFCASYLPRSPKTDGWLSFATQAFLDEITRQFHPDGSNFEGSVCYHRLSAEIALWGVALLQKLSPDKLAVFRSFQFWRGPLPTPRLIPPLALYKHQHIEGGLSPVPKGCLQRLAAMACFTEWLTRPDGRVVQFGDNDSGRFATMLSREQLHAGTHPDAPDWSLDHTALVWGIAAVQGQCVYDPGSRLLQGFAGVHPDPHVSTVAERGPEVALPADEREWDTLQNLYQDTPIASRVELVLHAKGSLTEGLSQRFFPGMGCCISRSHNLFMAIRCGEIGLHGLGAHAHCDQLALELVIDGRDIFRDPGSYLYTALPEARNSYRSVLAHCAPHVAEREPANLAMGPFDLRGLAPGECLYFGPKGFVGRHRGYGRWVYRMILINERSLSIRDFSPEGLLLADPRPVVVPFSYAYGRRETKIV